MIPKNCNWCHYYSAHEHLCLKHNAPTGNVNTCKNWFPNKNIVNMYETPELAEWEYNIKNWELKNELKTKEIL